MKRSNHASTLFDRRTCSDPIVSEPVPELVLPLAQAAGAQQDPVIQFDDELRVGAMPPPGQSGLKPTTTHDGATVRYGRLGDGLGATALISYLSEDARLTRNTLLRFADAPVVRFVEGTSAGQIDEIVRAVQLLNANLPRDFQLTVDSTPVSAVVVRRRSLTPQNRSESALYYAERRPTCAPNNTWPGGARGGAMVGGYIRLI